MNRTDNRFVLISIPTVDGGGSIEFAQLPVTVREYECFIASGGYKNQMLWSKRGWVWKEYNKIEQPKYWNENGYCDPMQPVTGVSFWEADAFARSLNCQLPTEAEWFFAATNGLKSPNPWKGDESLVVEAQAHLSFFGHYSEAAPAPVTSSTRSASEAGIRDLIGNVAEWTYPGSEPEIKPRERFGVLRGGSWWNLPFGTDSSFRDVVPLGVRDNQTGIRLVRRSGGLLRAAGADPSGSVVRTYEQTVRRPTKPFRQEGIPHVSEANWRLKVSGEGIEPKEFTLDQIKKRRRISQYGLFICVCRWAEKNVFQGMLVADLLQECGLDLGNYGRGYYLLQRSVIGPSGQCYETSVSVESAVKNDAILAFKMDGRDLTPELGWPIRYIDLTHYGYKGVKCLSEIVITDQFQKGWWEQACQYDLEGVIQPGTVTVVGNKVKRIDITRPGRVRFISSI